jgi:RimJ/RimL family protein N-acetyltransferase
MDDNDMETLVGRRTQIHPAEPAQYEQLFRLAMSCGTTWQWQGRPQSPEFFAETLWNDALCNYVVRGRENGRFLGLIRAYDYLPVHGTAKFGFFFDESVRGQGWQLESIGLFLRTLFRNYPIRKMYGHMAAPSLERYGRAYGRYAVIEGVLRDHFYYDGAYVDLAIVSVGREAFEGPISFAGRLGAAASTAIGAS